MPAQSAVRLLAGMHRVTRATGCHGDHPGAAEDPGPPGGWMPRAEATQCGWSF
jgi:hypothetical protein